MTSLTSTAPGIWEAFVNLVSDAAATVTILGNPVTVFPFEVTQNQPANYIQFVGMEGHHWEPEGIGYQFREDYAINGLATVFTGNSLSDDPSIANAVLEATYELFNTCVMTTMVENANIPILGTALTPFQGLPSYTRYAGQPGNQGGAQVGWTGEITFQYRFSALCYPG